MKVSELKRLLNRDNRHDDQSIKVVMHNPSVGGHDYEEAKHIWLGFDWDKGLMIKTETPIVRKENKQSIYEAATDLLMMLATEFYIKKKPKYENRRARDILLKFGYKEEDLIKFVKIFHRDKEIVKPPRN